MDIQTIIIYIIITICVAFIGLRIYKLLSGKGKPDCGSCTGCTLKDTCKKK